MKQLTALKFFNILVAGLIIVAAIRIGSLPADCNAETTTEPEMIIIEAKLVKITDNDEIESTTDNIKTIEETPTETTTEVITEVITEKESEVETKIESANSNTREYYTESDITMLCKVTYGEAGALSKVEQAAVVWCILNRVDSSVYPDTIAKVVTQPYQFSGYSESKPINSTTKSVVLDVLKRWVREKQGETDVGRVLPIEYMYFTGDGIKNTFRLSSSSSSQAWDWSLPNPYN